MKKNFLFFAFTVVLALFNTRTTIAAEVVDKIIAVVNSEPVLSSDFKELQQRLLKPQFIDENLLPEGVSPTQLKSSHSAQLQYLINDSIFKSKIKEKGLTATNDRVDLEIKELAKKGNVSISDLEVIIRKQGLTMAEFKDFQKEKLEKQGLLDSEVISKLRVSEEEIASEYMLENPKANPQTEEFTLSHIFFNPKKNGPAAAKTRAELAYSKLKAGEKFEKLVDTLSEDPNFTKGGGLGTFKAGEFIPELEGTVADLKEGAYSAVVKSKLGYHILKLNSRKVSQDPEYLKAKDQIRGKLMEVAYQRQLKQWLKTLRSEAYIKINE